MIYGCLFAFKCINVQCIYHNTFVGLKYSFFYGKKYYHTVADDIICLSDRWQLASSYDMNCVLKKKLDVYQAQCQPACNQSRLVRNGRQIGPYCFVNMVNPSITYSWNSFSRFQTTFCHQNYGKLKTTIKLLWAHH